MGLTLKYGPGQTPLEEEEIEGLKIPTVTTRGELDEFEQQNIEQAVQWVLMHTFTSQKIFTEVFVKELHRRMYGDVWTWAGIFRKTEKNIGGPHWRISVELKALLDDAVYWMNHEVYVPDEMAVRFKHRLVSIHCFPNGNGRHSRLMADVIIEKIYHRPVFTWGAADIIKEGQARTAYIQAIRKADAGDIFPLLEFARS